MGERWALHGRSVRNPWRSDGEFGGTFGGSGLGVIVRDQSGFCAVCTEHRNAQYFRLQPPRTKPNKRRSAQHMTLNVKSSPLTAQSSKLKAQSTKLKAPSSILNPQSSILNPQCSKLKASCSTNHSEHSKLQRKFQAQRSSLHQPTTTLKQSTTTLPPLTSPSPPRSPSRRPGRAGRVQGPADRKTRRGPSAPPGFRMGARIRPIPLDEHQRHPLAHHRPGGGR